MRDSRQRLRALAAHLQAIREEERARVAREIHDELGQALTCMKIDLWQIREESSLDPVDKDAVLQKIDGLLGFIDATVRYGEKNSVRFETQHPRRSRPHRCY